MNHTSTSPTEQRNVKSLELDSLSGLEIARLMNDEDLSVAEAVNDIVDSIGEAIEKIAQRLRDGGRLIYIGAGTSGRLGVLDAVECGPTFSADDDQVMAIIAGGDKAITTSIENSEDSHEDAITALKGITISKADALVAISASGNTPYAQSAMEFAKSQGAFVISLTSNPSGVMNSIADIALVVQTGAEVLTGSTRLKAGTAQKLVLNMLSTGTMVLIGKTYQNLMVDVRATNAKLIERCVRIVCEATGEAPGVAKDILEQCDYRPKVAILMLLADVDLDTATQYLDKNAGHLRKALNSLNNGRANI